MKRRLVITSVEALHLSEIGDLLKFIDIKPNLNYLLKSVDNNRD
jgi:hypothetical protein